MWFVIILAIILLVFIVGKIYKEEPVVIFDFDYGVTFVGIKTISQYPKLTDSLLIASYTYFLARYFLICDKRQAVYIQYCFLDNLSNTSLSCDESVSKIKEYIQLMFQETLSEKEKNAVIQMFSPLGFPPYIYSEKDSPLRSVAHYSFKLFNDKTGFASMLNMSFGPDIVLLPITTVLLYEFVIDKLSSPGDVVLLNKIIIDLLERYKTADYRSQRLYQTLPSEILRLNGVVVNS